MLTATALTFVFGKSHSVLARG